MGACVLVGKTDLKKGICNMLDGNKGFWER